MARTILLVMSLLLSAPSLAETIEFPNSDCSFAGTFEQSRALDGLENPLSSSGSFFYHCDYGVIWSTSEPVSETLVLKRNGQAFVIIDDTKKKLSSRQGKFLGSLLNSLMAGDVDAVDKQFAVTRVSNRSAENLTELGDRYELVPLKRSLKRGVKLITLAFIASAPEQNANIVEIEFIDRNAQTTSIRSSRERVFPANSAFEQNCASNIGASALACQILIAN